MFNFKAIQKTDVGSRGRGERFRSFKADCIRERLCRFGAAALSEAELLSCVLGAGGPVPAQELAANLLDQYGSLAQLTAENPRVLETRLGVGPARVSRLLASFELGIRAVKPVAKIGLLVHRPEDLFDLMRDEFRGLDRERFLALYLDTRHRVELVDTVSIGSLNASLVHPREVFKPAVALSAAAVIVAHNHPSGCPLPSRDDLELTARLDACGELMGIALLDHLVVGDNKILSIREHGWPVSADS